MMKKNILHSAALCAVVLGSSMAVHGQTVVDSFAVTGGTPDAVDNDYTRIQDALLNATSGETIELRGTFDLSSGEALLAYQGNGYPYSGNQAFGFLPPLWQYVNSGGSTVSPNVENVTLTSHGDGSEIVMPGLAVLEASTGIHMLFVHAESGTASHNQVQSRNFTVDGLTVTGPLEMVTGTTQSGNARMTGINILNNEFTLGVWRFSAASFILRHQDHNVTIDGNTFNLVANSAPGSGMGRLMEVVTMPSSGQIGGHNNFAFTNNTVNGVVDEGLFGVDGRPSEPWPTTYIVAVNENSNSRETNMFFDGNTFNGLVESGGESYHTIAVAYMPTTRPGQFFDPPLSTEITFADNTFIGVMTAWHSRNPELQTNPAHSEYLQKGSVTWYFPGATFESCGWQKELFVNPAFSSFISGSQRPQNPPDFSAITDPDVLSNALVIRNYFFAFSPDGNPPSNIFFDINLTVDGRTGVEALNYIASRPLFFESSDPSVVQGFGDYLPEQIGAGILPPASGSAVNEDWTGLPKWIDPIGGNSGLAIGYNAFGGTPDIGNPDFFADDPRSVIVLNLDPDTVTEFAPGTRINKTVIIQTDSSSKAAGANAATIAPSVASSANPLFLLEEGAELILNNLIITGNSPAAAGDRNIATAIRVQSGNTNANATVTSSTLTNFSGQVVQLSNSNTSTTIAESLITNSGGVYNGNTGTTGLNLVDSVVTNISATLFTVQNAGLELVSNHFRNNSSQILFLISHGSGLPFVIGGSPDEGNVFWDGFSASVNTPGGIYGRPSGYVFSGNWHADLFDPFRPANGLSSRAQAWVGT
ncbi:MAG: hypothetical protein JJU11_16615 [Candidatus Sumerlaeia bacterium]|nr:hypothetical protein [Candidatus Sumerlaeia bacterium]